MSPQPKEVPKHRVAFGTGILEPKPETSVFLNCPFDQAYQPIFDAIVFAVVACGFLPRCAYEEGGTSLSRMERITRIIFSSKYSIHDLSRCHGEGDENLARFNMPLELGIAMALKWSGASGEGSHDWLVLVPRGHFYKRVISDLAGYDPKEYDLTKESVVPAVMSWLATRPDAVRAPTPIQVLSVLKNSNSKSALWSMNGKDRRPGQTSSCSQSIFFEKIP